jgi:predicted small integral membrane protein
MRRPVPRQAGSHPGQRANTARREFPMVVRLCKVAMLLGLALFAFLVTFTNITDYDSNFEFVKHVLSMDTTFPDNAAMYRAITSPALWSLGYWMIILGEGLTCLFLAWGALRLFAARHASEAEFQSRKDMAVVGATLGFLVWFVGFMAVGGEWFLMWQSSTWNGQQAAFRFYISILAVLIFVMMPDPGPGARQGTR